MRSALVTEANADPAISFTLEVPANWQKFEPYKADGATSPGLHLLGRYGPPGGRCLVEVHSQVIDREISSADWFDVWLAANGYEVRESTRTTSSAGFDGRVLASKKLESGKTYVYRFATFKNGNRVYVVSGLAQPDEMAAFEPGYLHARDTFQLTAPNQPCAEPLWTATLDHAVKARIAVPSSWIESRDESAGPDQDSVTFRNRAPGETVGTMHVLVAPGTAFVTHQQVADRVLAAVAPMFKEPLPPLALAPVDLPLAEPQQGNTFVQAGPLWVRVRLTVARLNGAWTSILLVGFTPVPDNALVDAMNNRAYEIALTTLSAGI